MPSLNRRQWFVLAVHAGSLLPLAWLLFRFITGNLTINPIQEATIRTGRYALYWLLLSLACTPLNRFFGFRPALKVRRALGLYAFMYAAIHVFIFAVIDFALDWRLLSEALFNQPYILVGLSAFTILLALAVTSFQWWMKRLGKNWKRLHRFVYLAVMLAVVHYAWAAKGEVLRLQGDILQPAALGLTALLLLMARLPFVRVVASRMRRA